MQNRLNHKLSRLVGIVLAAAMLLSGCSPAATAPAATATSLPPTATLEVVPTATQVAPSPEPTATEASAQVDYQALVDTEAEWLAAQQFVDPNSSADGAITMYRELKDKSYIMPYFSNFAAWALLEKPEKYAPVVKRYMDWYFRHLSNPDFHAAMPPCGTITATVYDYWVQPDGTETPQISEETGKPYYDSTDSYAATFLELARRYAKATGDTRYLLDHRADLEAIANAMYCTMQADHLTWATPSYPVKLLMDNSEVYLGYDAAGWLASEVFKDEKLTAYYGEQKAGVGKSIEEKLWDPASNLYVWYLDEDGGKGAPDLKIFYPDAVAQLYPAFGGVIAIDSPRAKQLYATFNSAHPLWSTVKDPAQDPANDFPWAILSYQAALMGDRARADEYLATVKGMFIDKGHPWPWYIMEAAFTLMAARQLSR